MTDRITLTLNHKQPGRDAADNSPSSTTLWSWCTRRQRVDVGRGAFKNWFNTDRRILYIEKYTRWSSTVISTLFKVYIGIVHCGRSIHAFDAPNAYTTLILFDTINDNVWPTQRSPTYTSKCIYATPWTTSRWSPPISSHSVVHSIVRADTMQSKRSPVFTTKLLFFSRACALHIIGV